MSESRKTTKEIIDETEAYYAEDPKRRAIDAGGSCLYHHGGTGNMCAFGRCMTEEGHVLVVDKRLEGEGADAVLSAAAIAGVEVLQEPYRGHSPDFWGDLQALHDSAYYWSGPRSLFNRQDYVAELRARFDNEE